MKASMRKIRFISILCLLICSGIAVFLQVRGKSERRIQIKEMQTRGEGLVSLIAMIPVTDFAGMDRKFFLRVLAEYITRQGLVYCIVSDQAETPLLTFLPNRISPQIPDDIRVRALYAKGILEQSFRLEDGKGTIYEFAKPVFANGKKAGVVRVGLKLPDVPFYAMLNISTTAQIIFFAIAILAFAYYEVLASLKLLHKPEALVGNLIEQEGIPESRGRIGMILESTDRMLARLDEELSRSESDNLSLKALLGAIQFEKKQLLTILDSLDSGMIITDFQDTVFYVSSYALDLLGREREEMIDRSLSEVVDHESVRSWLHPNPLNEQGGGASPAEITFPRQAPDQYFRVSTSVLVDAEGTAAGKIICLINITKEKAAKKFQEDFIANISHELMTPLTNIQSYSEMLMDDEITNLEMQKEFFNTINDETNRLSALIKNIMNIAKMEVGELVLNRGILKTDWLAESSVKAIEASALDKQIRIETDMPDNFPVLFADKDLLKAALINILGNALKYTPPGGRITFAIREQDNMVVFDVSDTGYGISEEDQAHIFEKFYRSANDRVMEQTGSGLGLSITSEIVRHHGGVLEVTSELGKGSCFTMKIPKEDYYLGER